MEETLRFITGRQVDIKTESDFAFLYLCANGYLELSKQLLEICPDINVRADDDYTFRLTCGNGHLNIAKWLLDIRPDIDVRACDDEPFRRACKNGQRKVVKWLLEVNQNIGSDSAYFLRLVKRRPRIKKILLKLRQQCSDIK